MHPAPTALNCPKCNGTMRAYERNGVVIDQCGDCRGIFLDRGELERLVDAESAFYQTVDTRAAPPRPLEFPRAATPTFRDMATMATATTVAVTMAATAAGHIASARRVDS